MTALVVGRPEYYTPRAKLVRIKYENSTRYEYMINNQLEALFLLTINIQHLVGPTSNLKEVFNG